MHSNKPRQIIGVSFDLNDTVVNIGGAFNTRRNARFMEKGDEMEQHNAVGQSVHRAYKRFKMCRSFIKFFIKSQCGRWSLSVKYTWKFVFLSLNRAKKVILAS